MNLRGEEREREGEGKDSRVHPGLWDLTSAPSESHCCLQQWARQGSVAALVPPSCLPVAAGWSRVSEERGQGSSTAAGSSC